MYFLTYKEGEFVVNGKMKEVEEYLNAEKSFLEEHILQWVPAFCECVEANTKLNFFIHLSRATKDFVLQEREYLRSLLG